MNKRDYIKIDKCIYKNKKTKRFIVDLYIGKDDFGKQIRTTKTFNNLKDARKYLFDFKNKKYQGNIEMNIKKKDIFFSQLIKDYLYNITLINYRETTIASDKNIERHILHFFKDIPLNKVNSTKINQYFIHQQKNGLKSSTLKKHECFLRRVFQYAIGLYDVYAIKENPMDNVMRIKCKKKNNYAYLEPNEIIQFQSIMEDENSNLLLPYMIAVYTGMRRGEICALRFDDIDFKNNTITICRNCVSVGSKIILTETTKTNMIRKIPISQHLKTILKSQYIQNNKSKKLDSNFNPDNLVIVNSKGQVINPTVLSVKFGRFIDKHDLKKVTFHQLRHSFVTNSINLTNMSITDVAQTVGNSKEVCLRIYSHESQNASQNVIKEFDKIFENSII